MRLKMNAVVVLVLVQLVSGDGVYGGLCAVFSVQLKPYTLK